MFWAKFVVFFSLYCPISAAVGKFVHLELGSGATLEVPAQLFHQVDIKELATRQDFVLGFSESGESLFAYTSLKEQNYQGKLLEVLNKSGILAMLRKRGMRNPQFAQVAGSRSGSRLDQSMFRIIDEASPFNNFMLFLATRPHINGSAIFILMAPQNEYYTVSSGFSEMVLNYTVRTNKLGEKVTPPLLVAAIFLLLGNLIYVWYGFYRIAYVREQGGDD